MRKALFPLALFFAVINVSAQTILTQKTTVREQNSQKRPIAGAQVIFEGAVPTDSDQKGIVKLAFQNKQPGAYVFLTEVSKAGYELVNKTELEQVKLSNTEQLGQDIILAPAGQVDAAKKAYYDISDKSLLAGFEKEKRQLRKALSDARLSQQQFDDRYKQLQEQYDNQKKELDGLAEKFARVNFDDVDSLYREALELFKGGKIDAAIGTLESADPVKLIGQIIGQEQQDAKDQKELDARKQATAKSKTVIISQVRLLADMYSVKFDPEKAEALFDGLLRLDSTDLSILRDAADFYRQNHRYEKALHVLPLIIAHPQTESWQRANAYGHVGDMCNVTGRLEDAMQSYLACQKAYIDLLEANPGSSFCKENLAVSFQNLGITHTALGNLDKALMFFEGFHRLEKALYEAYPNSPSFKKGLAGSYEKLGSMHTSLGNLDKALIFYEHEFKLFKELYDFNPNNLDYKYHLAISYAKLGETHTVLGNLDKALMFFEDFNHLEAELFDAYPNNASFINGLAISYAKLGETHASLGNLDKTLKFYEDCNRLEKGLYDTYSNNVSFKNGLAISYARLGVAHTTLGNLDKALQFYEDNNRLEAELFDTYPNNVEFKNGLAISYSNLGETHTALGNLDKALKFYEERSRLGKELFGTYPNNVEFKNGLAISYSNLGETHTALGNLDKALKFYEDYTLLEKELHNAYPNNVEFKNGLAISYSKLGRFSRDHQHNNAKARDYFRQSESLWVELVRDAPQYADFQRSLKVIRNNLENLDKENDPVFLLNSRIKNESDTLAKYQLYATLCDTLRQRILHNPNQKAALADAINNRAWLGFFLQKFEAVETDIREGLALETGNKFLPTNLAPALLLQGKVNDALKEYKKWKDQAFGEQDYPTYREAFLDDLKTFEKAGIIPAARAADVAAVRKMLMEK